MGRPEDTVWIISVGNEILVGRIVNTNAAYLARRLTFLGFRVVRITTVPDDVDEIAGEVRGALGRARVVLTTGGLGPTYDDVTLEGVARAVFRRLTVNREALEMVKRFYESKGLELTEERVKMAMLPEGAEALPNPVGAAPGSYLELPDGGIVVSMPGVPAEMKAMFEDYVVPRLSKIAPPRRLAECYVVVRGVPESSLAPALEEIARRHPKAYVKSHPKGHELREPVLEVRVLASAESLDDARREAEEVVKLVAEEAARLGGTAGEVSCEETG